MTATTTSGEVVAVAIALWLVAAASVVHVIEEYWWPGGFLDSVRHTAPPFAFAVNTTIAVIINGMFLAGAVIAALIGSRVPIFGLSVAALIAINGWGHVAGTLRGRRYVPGAASGLLLAQPIAIVAYVQFDHAGLLSAYVLVTSVLLGAAYHLVPLSYFGIRWLIRNHQTESIART